ncbi:MAG TPA: hypothetical protein DCX71_14260 [Erythrobacter sp.]|jgi:hypothetical protein|nr:hypothetical protein [Erythrobacter sp.]|tara:strand:+ start:503 stop:922 length:420 start_codon:yes stop_codon:yes gene_type:complete
MEEAPKAPANAGITMSDAEDIIRRQRIDKGKPPSCRPRAVDLVRNNEPIIRQLRDAGYKQEDAVLLLLDLGHEGHQPDTLRKALASVLGPWNSRDADVADSTLVADNSGQSPSTTNGDASGAVMDGGRQAVIGTERKRL